jgi:cytochrome c1
MTTNIFSAKGWTAAVLAAGLAIGAGAASASEAGGHAVEIARQPWTFAGFSGKYDKDQLQRGFQVYKEVCAACHSLKRVYFRNLVEKGGPEFPEEAIKALAAEWPNQIADETDAGESVVKTKDKDGKVTGFKLVTRPARLSDPILGPYRNDKEARAAQNGALPPDLSLITRARGVEHHATWYTTPINMVKDISKGYQEGGADYLYALLTGYKDPPKDFHLNDGMLYNTVFPGNQISMPPPLSADPAAPSVKYQDGTGSLEQNARDVTAFLSWAGDPTLNQRKRMGSMVLLYLIVTTLLLYLGKRKIWSNVAH